MSRQSPKTIDGLMRHLRDDKQIAISGSAQKRKLMNIGYYHGYKGYRYIRKATNLVPYKSFNELVAVYEFDAQLKAVFYPFVMRIETALKNYVLEVIVGEIHSDSFINVYSRLLDNYRMFSTSGKTYETEKERRQAEDKYKYELKRRLELRNRIYRVQTESFANEKRIAVHYLNKDVNLPIWAIFELLSLGEFGHFVSCLNFSCRKKISTKIGIRQSDDARAVMPQRLIYATKDLRNAIAHNEVIFDARFRTSKIDKQMRNAISNATGVQNLKFDTVTDYLVLIIYQLSLFKMSKNDMKRLISSFEECTERLRSAIPFNVYSQIIFTDNNAKIAALRRFMRS